NITNGSTAAENPQPTRIYATFGHCGTAPGRPHLHSPCKGANKTPLDQAAWPLACTACLQGSLARKQDGEGPVRPPPPGGASESGAEAPCAPAQASRLRSLFASFRSRRGCGADQGQERDEYVTTMSSAEPTRRDFLYIATGAVAAVGAAAALVPLI